MTEEQARLEPRGEGLFVISGSLSFATVPELWHKGLAAFGTARELKFDLQGISRSDSAGLALLIEWMRYARRANKRITFLNIPEQMLAIARASSLDDILPLERSGSRRG